MKKVIIAFIAGALVMVSGQAIANTVSQIGNKVDSEAAVYVNGERVSDAIIIKGKSYFPGRDVVEKMGGTVEWKGSVNSIMITNELSTNEEIAEYNAKLIDYNKQKADITTNISSANRKIERLEGMIEKYTSDLETASESYKIFLNDEIKKRSQELEEEKANLAKYEKELQELESTK